MDDRKPHILVVDDEPVMRTITESVLAQQEFEVSTASSAEQAILMISEGFVPDLLLLDVLMPGMNGFEACRILRRKHRLEHLPIIMLTALDDQISIDEAYRCGATDFITKPLNIPLLPHRIRYLLRSAMAIRELFDSQITLINTQQIARLGNWTMDADGNIIRASREYLDIVGLNQLPVPERRLLPRVHREDRTTLLRQRAEMRMGRPYRLDYRLRSTLEDDVWYHVHERGIPRFDERQQYIGAEGFTQDISERVAQEEKIRNLAWHDPVTGLNNRARAIELLDRDAGQRDSLHQLSMVFIYLANLRDVQTVLGQEIADAVIRALAGRLKGMLEHPGEDCRLDADCLQQVKLARYDEHSLIATLPGELDKEKRDAFAHAIAVSLALSELAREVVYVTEISAVDGHTIVPPYRVDPDTGGAHFYPSLAYAPNGSLAVAWQAADRGGTAARLFDDQGRARFNAVSCDDAPFAVGARATEGMPGRPSVLFTQGRLWITHPGQPGYDSVARGAVGWRMEWSKLWPAR